MGLFDMFGDFTTPTYFPSNSGSDYQSDFPLQQFRDDSLGSMFSQQQNYMPAQSAYLDYLQGAVPTQKENEPGFWTRLGIGLTGALGNIGGQNGGQIVDQLLNEKYNRAMQDYKVRGQSLGQAAQSEQQLAGLNRQGMQDQFEREKFGKTSGLEQQKITQAGELGRGELDVKKTEAGLRQQTLENQIQQQALDRALQEKRIGIEQYNSATSRLNAEANVKQSGAMADFYGRRDPGGPAGKTPSSAEINKQIQSRLQMDPDLAPYTYQILRGDFNVNELDEMAKVRLQSILRQAGRLPSADIPLGR